MRIRVSSPVLLSAALAAAVPRPASACGGCLAPPDTTTSVSGHRMVVSLSTTRTILWDQIRYTGNPKDFVWVLPVPSGDVTVELADVTFFDGLDGSTGPMIQPRRAVAFSCFDGSASMGCGGAASASGGGGDLPEEQVTVYDQSVVGPYETATIGAEDPVALTTWLREHGYRVTAEVEPTLEHYVGQGSAFVALRLQPGQGVQAMQPVRVEFPGYMGTFPLKMVTVGASGVLDLTLWVFAEQRYEPANYATTTVRSDDLVWDWDTSLSNYPVAFDRAIDRAGGRAWVVEFADSVAYFGGIYTGPEVTRVREDISVPYLTRLHSRMLVDYLDEDLELGPAQDPASVSNFLVAAHEVNRPEEPDCDEEDDVGCAISVSRRARMATSSALVLLVGLFLVRRRARRSR